MKPILSDQDRNRLEQHIAEAEKRTRTQIVLAVVRRSDSYAELPWAAFALGASVTGLLVCITDALSNGWTSYPALLFAVTLILGTGVAFAILAVLVPRFARLLLTKHRAETEVRQYAESLFFRRELSATAGRTGILLLVGLFERSVVLLPDRGLTSRLPDDAMRGVIAQMTPHLAQNNVNRAMEAGLKRLSQVLEVSSPGRPAGSGENELPDQIIEEKGA
jgi:putative membrane protein